MDRTARQKINKETEGLNNVKNQLNLTDIYRKLHSTAAEYTFLSARGTLSKTNHSLGHKTSLISEDCNHVEHLFYPQGY